MKLASFILHQRRAQKFYNLLGNVDEGAVTVRFDMTQNLAHFLKPQWDRHIIPSNCTRLSLVLLSNIGKAVHRKRPEFIYIHEHENRKDSNVISSALDKCFLVSIKCASVCYELI